MCSPGSSRRWYTYVCSPPLPNSLLFRWRENHDVANVDELGQRSGDQMTYLRHGCMLRENDQLFYHTTLIRLGHSVFDTSSCSGLDALQPVNSFRQLVHQRFDTLGRGELDKLW